jgi:hypothetical protein
LKEWTETKKENANLKDQMTILKEKTMLDKKELKRNAEKIEKLKLEVKSMVSIRRLM